MIWVLDTNFFIDAQRLHLPLESKPEFWDFIVSLAREDRVTIPSQVFDEICRGNDALKAWMISNKAVLVSAADFFGMLPGVLNDGYQFQIDIDLENLNADPYVIALASSLHATVVTSEKPRPGAAPHNRKIPDVCKTLNIPCISITTFIWEARQQWTDPQEE